MESESLKQQINQAVLDPAREPDPFSPLEDILATAEEENLLPMVCSVTESALKEPGVNLPKYFLHGFAQFRLGNPEGAWPALVPLAGKLEQGSHWRTLAALCGRALEYAPRVEAALHIAKAFESAGLENLDPAFLHRAYDNFPDESRLSYLMGESKAREAARVEGGIGSPAGQSLMEEARAYWGDALGGFVALKRHSQIEEVILKLADSSDPGILRHILSAVRKMGEQSQWGRMEAALELALPGLHTAGLIHDLWQILLHLLPQAPAAINLRKHIRELAPKAFPQAQGILDLLNRSGVLDPDIKAETALKALEPLLALAPGYYVLHASWGVGQIKINDGETVILDFTENQNHRMSLSLARRALLVVPQDDLRVQKALDPEGVKKRFKEDPAGTAYLVIRQLGDEASSQEMKRTLLADGILTASQWTPFWKETKLLMEQDDRFDLSQAFRQTYRTRSASSEDETIALPTLEPRRGVRPNLNLIRRFLEQHPDQMARAARTYGGILQRWARQERTSAEDRMAIHLQLYRWNKKMDEEFVAALAGMLAEQIEAGVFSDEDDQKLIVEAGLSRKETWKHATYFALSSRYPQIRGMALARLREDPKTGRELLRILIENPSERPMASLAGINLAITRTGQTEPFAPSPWEAAIAASLLVESTSREPLRKQAMSMLAPDALLVEEMLASPPSDGQLDAIGQLVRRWRSSERFLEPLLSVMRRAGLQDLVLSLRSERMAKTNQILMTQAELDHFEYPAHLMTLATFHRLKGEMERLNYELKTTVAQAMAKARALGDLRESGEFESAKLKQSNYATRIATLASILGEAKIIEDLPRPTGRVAPGTQVTLEDLNTGAVRTLWILGEGDDVHGAEVISYTAPLGKALLGHRVTDHIRLPGEETTHQFEIRSVTPRVPADSTPSGAGAGGRPLEGASVETPGSSEGGLPHAGGLAPDSPSDAPGSSGPV